MYTKYNYIYKSTIKKISYSYTSMYTKYDYIYKSTIKNNIIHIYKYVY